MASSRDTSRQHDKLPVLTQNLPDEQRFPTLFYPGRFIRNLITTQAGGPQLSLSVGMFFLQGNIHLAQSAFWPLETVYHGGRVSVQRPFLPMVEARGLLAANGEYSNIKGLMSNGAQTARSVIPPETDKALGRESARIAPTIHGCASPISSSGRVTDLRCLEESRSARPPRVLFLGMQGNFSYPPLRALLEAGIEVCAVVIPAEKTLKGDPDLPAIRRREQPQASRSMLPVLQSTLHTSILQLAWEQRIPVWEVRQVSSPETISMLAAYQPDVICVACFSKRIPRAILDIPHLGCLNVHPSLLPTNRGPEPLFWTFREGDKQTGVTIHLMDDGMDTGPVVAQEAIVVPDGIGYAQLEAQCAELGGKLLARSVLDLYNGVAVPVLRDETKSSYHAFPSDNDFVVPVAEWSARHVYNFICGVASWGTPIMLQIGDNIVHVKNAISYSQNDTGRGNSELNGQPGERFWVRCKQGSVAVTKT